jgi:hypothetical protein
MAQGRLQCVGSSLHLKQKFGAGYRITVGTNEKKVDEVVQFFKENLPGKDACFLKIAHYILRR